MKKQANFSVEVRIRIEGVPVLEVYNRIATLSLWRHWSPLFVIEGRSTLKLVDGNNSGSGGGSSSGGGEPIKNASNSSKILFSGNLIGSGSYTLTHASNCEDIHVKQEFFAPWPALLYSEFELEEDVIMKEEKRVEITLITWRIRSQMPFFLFFLRDTVASVTRMDCDRGLKMLKDYCELGIVPSHIERKGVKQMKPIFDKSFRNSSPGTIHYLCRDVVSNLDGLGGLISKGFEEMRGEIAVEMNCGDSNTGGIELIEGREAFSMYDKTDIVGDLFECRICMEISEGEKISMEKKGVVGKGKRNEKTKSSGSKKKDPSNPSASLSDCSYVDSMHFNATASGFVLEHTGPYRHLGNVWACAIAHTRSNDKNQAVVPVRGLPMIERYVNNYGQESDEKTLTQIVIQTSE